MTDALRATRSITDECAQAHALAAIAGALAAVNPDRATRLATDAKHLGQSIPDSSFRAPALATVAENLAALRASRPSWLG